MTKQTMREMLIESGADPVALDELAEWLEETFADEEDRGFEEVPVPTTTMHPSDQQIRLRYEPAEVTFRLLSDGTVEVSSLSDNTGSLAEIRDKSAHLLNAHIKKLRSL